MVDTQQAPSRVVRGVVTAVGVLLGVGFGVLTHDVVLGVIAGAGFVASTLGVLRVWTGGSTTRPHSP